MYVEFTEQDFTLAPGEVYERGATISGPYRYVLTRRWAEGNDTPLVEYKL